MKALLKRIVLAFWRPIERHAAGAYLAGPHLSDALAVGDRFAARGYGVVLGFWNADDDGPEAVARENLAVIEALRVRPGDWYLSVKAPALGYSRELVQEIETSAQHAPSMAPPTRSIKDSNGPPLSAMARSTNPSFV